MAKKKRKCPRCGQTYIYSANNRGYRCSTRRCPNYSLKFHWR